MTDQAVMELAPQLGVRAACEAVGAAQAGYYRRHRQSPLNTSQRCLIQVDRFRRP
jgi:putative transposase